MKTKIFQIGLALGFIILSSCKGPKGDTGSIGPDGPGATTFNFQLTFNPGDTYKSYGGITGFDENDVVIVYMFSATYGSDYYVQLPYMLTTTSANIWPEFSEDSGNIFINTTKPTDINASPWTSSITLGFKAVLIKSKSFIEDVNYKNYEEVQEVYNLKD